MTARHTGRPRRLANSPLGRDWLGERGDVQQVPQRHAEVPAALWRGLQHGDRDKAIVLIQHQRPLPSSSNSESEQGISLRLSCQALDCQGAVLFFGIGSASALASFPLLLDALLRCQCSS